MPDQMMIQKITGGFFILDKPSESQSMARKNKKGTQHKAKSL